MAATSQEMMRKNIQGPGEVKEFYFESGKIDILKENLEKLKQADTVVPLKAGRNI